MRVLVFGGRKYSDWHRLCSVLDFIHESVTITEVIQGKATGADTLALNWAMNRAVKARSFPADWKMHGRRAGPIRNQQMLNEGKPDMAVGFPGGSGTNDMSARCLRRGVPIYFVDWDYKATVVLQSQRFIAVSSEKHRHDD